MNNINLRPYQAEIVNNIREQLKLNYNRVITQLPCGGGKSFIQADISINANNKGNRVLFLVHVNELCDQIKSDFAKCGVDFELTDIAMVQTMTRRVLDYDPNHYQLILIDEAHHSSANTYVNIINHFNCPVLGFTATPVRQNGKGLGEVFQKILTSVSTKWLIDNHYLAPYRYFSVPLVNTGDLKITGGDYNKKQVSELMNNKEIYGETVEHYRKIANGKQTIVYTADVNSAIETANKFTEQGFKAMALSAKTPVKTREKAMEDFRKGDLQILCNCMLFGEGISVDGCECVILARPTASLSLYIQMSMRCMRYLPNKTALILDLTGNCFKHGLPDDDRQWTLESRKKQETTVKIKECKTCFAVYPPTEKACPYCGDSTTIIRVQTGKKTIEVDLVEVERQEKLKNTRISDADLKTWEEIEEFRKAKGYKIGWAIRYADQRHIKVPHKYNNLRRFMKG